MADRVEEAKAAVAAAVAVVAAGSVPAPADFASARPAGTGNPTNRARRALT